MSFGLTNALATFNHLMHEIFREHLDEFLSYCSLMTFQYIQKMTLIMKVMYEEY